MKTEEELPAEAEVVAYLAAVQKVWNGASPELRAEYVAAIESGKFIIPPGKPMMREQLFPRWLQAHACSRIRDKLYGFGLTFHDADLIANLTPETRARLLLDGRSIP